jgi:hypothetical protein
MKRNDESSRAVFPRCSPSVSRWACSAALLLLALSGGLLAACGSAALSPGGTPTGGSPTGAGSTGARPVAFTDVATTQGARYDGPAAVLVGSSDAAREEIVGRVPNATAAADRVLVGAFQGGKRTGGFSIRVSAIERDGDRLIVHAAIGEPRRDSIVTQVLTSPAHVVSVARADMSGAREVVLVDLTGTERARAAIS